MWEAMRTRLQLLCYAGNVKKPLKTVVPQAASLLAGEQL